MPDLICEDCNEFSVNCWLNPHDETLMEFECRTCRVRWSEPADDESLVYDCYA